MEALKLPLSLGWRGVRGGSVSGSGVGGVGGVSTSAFTFVMGCGVA